ncbi:MAG: DsbA family oxidoreductase [Alicyclobacillus sp.]|nr:DsbA family oxidoreductase [Alicyclobacillus sp.]
MRIDIFQDTVCPWCRIGKAHLFEALARWREEPVEIRWRAFLLDPDAPDEGRPASVLAAKLGGEARMRQMHQRICQLGEACGIDFRFDAVERLPNTRLSHQLIAITPQTLRTRMVDAITRAYFEEGRDIGQLSVLLDLAASLGLDRDETRVRLEAGEGLASVEADLAFAREAGITGVPFFIFNDRLAVSGAQPVEVFVQALNEARAMER